MVTFTSGTTGRPLGYKRNKAISEITQALFLTRRSSAHFSRCTSQEENPLGTSVAMTNTL